MEQRNTVSVANVNYNTYCSFKLNIFVVSMGGTAGLFMGASLLSFVEVLYYFFPKALWDIYISRRNAKKIMIIFCPLVYERISHYQLHAMTMFNCLITTINSHETHPFLKIQHDNSSLHR